VLVLVLVIGVVVVAMVGPVANLCDRGHGALRPEETSPDEVVGREVLPYPPYPPEYPTTYPYPSAAADNKNAPDPATNWLRAEDVVAELHGCEVARLKSRLRYIAIVEAIWNCAGPAELPEDVDDA